MIQTSATGEWYREVTAHSTKTQRPNHDKLKLTEVKRKPVDMDAKITRQHIFTRWLPLVVINLIGVAAILTIAPIEPDTGFLLAGIIGVLLLYTIRLVIRLYNQ